VLDGADPIEHPPSSEALAIRARTRAAVPFLVILDLQVASASIDEPFR
jgi:hypothetical protein